MLNSKLSLSRALGISIQTLNTYERTQGEIPKCNGEYELDTVIFWFSQHPHLTLRVKTAIEKKTGKQIEVDLEENEPSEWLEEKRKWEARRSELAFKKEAKELVVLSEYLEGEATRYSLFKKSLEQLTYSLPPRLENLTNEEMKKELQRQFDELLKQLQRDLK